MQNNVQLTFRRIHKFTFRFDILRSYELTKLKITEKLSNFNNVILIAYDFWTVSSQNMGYICAIVHYINFDYELYKKIITFESLEYLHSSVIIYQTLVNIFYEYKINNSIFFFNYIR